MSVLRYCCFCWLLCIRADVFEPSRPLACNIKIVLFYLWLELCCDIFPWVLDLDHTHLHVLLVYGQIKGVTSWYQRRLPVGIALPNSLVEVESSYCKTFTNMAVWLTGPRRHWVVLGSFIPRPILWDSDISSIRVKWIFTKSNIRISLSFSPGEPLITADRLLHQKTLKILSAVNPRTCVHRVCNSPSTANPYG